MQLPKNLDPELAVALEPVLAHPEALNVAGDLAGVRAMRGAMTDEVLASFAMPDGLTQRNINITPSSGEKLKLVMVEPMALHGESAPLIYLMHGGGLVLGTADQDIPLLAEFAQALQCRAVSVDYRLAPETTFPGPIDDCFEGLVYLLNNAGDHGIDISRVAVAGISAGGTLAAALAMRMRDETTYALAAQCLIYPMLDQRTAAEPGEGDDFLIWPGESNRFGWQSYLGDDNAHATNPIAVPSRAESLGDLPSAYIMVGGLDLFLDENIDYARRLTAADVPCELHIYPGCVHGFDALAPDANVSRRSRREVLEFLARSLGC
ncbi:alpha/beta hydrolase fold-3 domain protein [Luminiphilus syltensis NOR5-1B]|uniref:Alpha/beta hydrolase fold-3 domain protein n=1 Tax=Luminiphilus syltensis NOR5-1B TaxID=565045 RepID=B8KWT2_9GAMM|nr:alpha/beta hydrolase [Luminiphilus syltensis]EED34354.1 alpha/beta hydrolase fold-3 domain protein [Luminiphilus syltensis NOR5-1B]